MKKLYHVSTSVLLLLILLISGCSINSGIPTNTSEILGKDPSGTAPHIEREFKSSVISSNKSLDELAALINSELKDSVNDKNLWNAPKVEGVTSDYWLDDAPEKFFYYDIYFDTSDDINLKNDISYRLRERFKSASDYEDHLKEPIKKKYYPYRIEFQAKTDRKEAGNGLSQSNEARFEFRLESDPFSAANPPPFKPWNLDEFIRYFQQGTFKEFVTWPARSIVDAYKKLGIEDERLYFSPSVVVLDERRRIHFNIKTPWGSGPNPEQSFIITLDSTKSYEARSYLAYMKARADKAKKSDKPKKIAEFVEIEIEFERNVSDKLDKEIEKATGVEREALVLAREAFLADQRVIMSTLAKRLGDKKIKIVPMTKSKYTQAREADL